MTDEELLAAEMDPVRIWVIEEVAAQGRWLERHSELIRGTDVAIESLSRRIDYLYDRGLFSPQRPLWVRLWRLLAG